MPGWPTPFQTGAGSSWQCPCPPSSSCCIIGNNASPARLLLPETSWLCMTFLLHAVSACRAGLWGHGELCVDLGHYTGHLPRGMSLHCHSCPPGAYTSSSIIAMHAVLLMCPGLLTMWAAFLTQSTPPSDTRMIPQGSPQAHCHLEGFAPSSRNTRPSPPQGEWPQGVSPAPVFNSVLPRGPGKPWR